MTPDQAADLLATLTLNGGAVRKTARQLGRSPGTVSKLAKKAGQAVAAASGNGNVKKRDYTELWGNAEELAVTRGVDLLPVSSLGQVAIFSGIAADKRYREEHPEFQGNRTLIDQSQHVHIDTNAALEALILAQKQLKETNGG